jgi:hypothetical protein
MLFNDQTFQNLPAINTANTSLYIERITSWQIEMLRHAKMLLDNTENVHAVVDPLAIMNCVLCDISTAALVELDEKDQKKNSNKSEPIGYFQIDDDEPNNTRIQFCHYYDNKIEISSAFLTDISSDTVTIDSVTYLNNVLLSEKADTPLTKVINDFIRIIQLLFYYQTTYRQEREIYLLDFFFDVVRDDVQFESSDDELKKLFKTGQKGRLNYILAYSDAQYHQWY